VFAWLFFRFNRLCFLFLFSVDVAGAVVNGFGLFAAVDAVVGGVGSGSWALGRKA
jgi:hypothetical protein